MGTSNKAPKVIDPLRDNRWDDFVRAHPESTVFHLSNWARVIADTYGYAPRYFAVEDDSGKIREGWPFFLANDGIRSKKLISAPFTDLIDPLIDPKGESRVFLDAILESCRNLSCKRVEIRGRIPDDTQGLLKRAELFKTFELHLQDQNESAIWNGFHGSVKRGIKKAQKHEIKILKLLDQESVRSFYKMNIVTRKKHGVLPQPYELFSNIWKHLIRNEMGFVMLATVDEKPISSAVFLQFNKTLHYKYGASYTQYLKHRPNNLIFWEAIRSAMQSGLHYFDLGRVSPENEGLLQFKRHWGAQEIDLPYHYYPEVTGVSSMKQDSLKYRIATSILRRSPVGLLEFLGTRVYKYLS